VGSRTVRFLLAQVILHLLRRDSTVRAWYLRIKRRRGSKIARVAVMRRTAVIMWRMLSTGEAWRPGNASAGSEGDDSRPTQPRRRRRTVLSGLLAGDGDSSTSSTGSSSLLTRTGEEVTSCPA
jgi:hypothetical protein